QLLQAFHIPHDDRGLRAAGDQRLAVGSEEESLDVAAAIGPSVDAVIRDIVDPDAGGMPPREELAVGRERHGIRRATRELMDDLLGWQIADADAVGDNRWLRPRGSERKSGGRGCDSYQGQGFAVGGKA